MQKNLITIMYRKMLKEKFFVLSIRQAAKEIPFYSLAMGTASLATAGLAMAGVALPGVIVIGGVIILSIGFEHLIRAITGYWE